MGEAVLEPVRPVDRSALPPGPSLPAALQAVKYVRDPLGFHIGLYRAYGDLFTVSLPTIGRVVYVASPGLVKEIFTSPPTEMHAGEANLRLLEPAFGRKSLLTMDEAPHMHRRKLMLPSFHGEQIPRYESLVTEVTLREMESWPVGKPFRLRAHSQRIAIATILKAVFGSSVLDRYERAVRVIDTFSRRSTAAMVPVLQRNLGRFSPWTRFVKARTELDKLIFEEIDRHRRGLDDDPGALISVLLQARDEDGEPIGDDELRDQVVTLIGAGNDTTATAIAWAFERLLRTPRALTRLRESIAAGEDDYLDATIKETLRVRPVISEVMRQLAEPAEVGGYRLPAGTGLRPAVAALHYREDLFPRPDEFRPERFLEEKAESYTWLPFGGGVRRCVGASLAEFEIRTVLRTILQRAELSAPYRRPERVTFKRATLAPAKDTMVILRRPLS